MRRPTMRKPQQHMYSLIVTCAVIITTTTTQRFVSCTGEAQSTVAIPLDEADILGPLCELDRDLRHDVEHVNADMEYWYAVGTNGPLTNLTLLKLEQMLYTSVKEEVLWCTTIPTTAGSGNDESGTETQRLGTVTFTPGNNDISTEYECTGSNFTDFMSATGATHCTVVHGEMSILSHPVDRIEYAVTALRSHIQSTINTSIVGRDLIANVQFLSYLGNSEDEILSGITVGGTGTAGSTPGSGGRNNADPVSNLSPNDDDKDGEPLLFGLAFAIPVAAVVLASAISARNDRKKAFNQLLHRPDEGKPTSVEDIDDPPGSFHEGMHHYMRDGTRYYSARCAQCREHNCVFLLDTSFTSSKMEAIPENDTFDRSEKGKILPRPDVSLGLSQHHMGINVHMCKSATCNRCSPNSPQPTFIPTGASSRSVHHSSSSTTTSSPISSNNSSSARSSAHSSLYSDMPTPTATTFTPTTIAGQASRNL